MAGGTAIAYIAAGRSYLLIFQDSNLELVRDFVLRSDDRDFDPQAMTELITSELRRSFLYFGQRAQGATVDRLVLAGPMANMTDVAARLRNDLGITVELFDASGAVDLGSADPYDQPALAVALGASTMAGLDGGSLVAPEEATERRTQRAVAAGTWVAAAILLLLGGWALWSFVSGSLQQSRLDDANARIAARQAELSDAQARVAARTNHAIRSRLLEQRAFESTLVGAVLQRVGQRVPDQLALESLHLRPVAGPNGSSYWDAEISGLVLGASRSESQAIFNRFFALLESDPLVESAHLTEDLQVGNAAERAVPEFAQPSPLAGANRAGLNRIEPTEHWHVVGRNPWLRLRPNFGRGIAAGSTLDGSTLSGSAAGAGADARSTIDSLPPFEATTTSVGFTVLLQLKAIAPGGAR